MWSRFSRRDRSDTTFDLNFRFPARQCRTGTSESAYWSREYEYSPSLDYPPEMRPIPKVDYAIVKKALSKAIQDGGLWLVYGNDSVFSEAPTAIQMDAD